MKNKNYAKLVSDAIEYAPRKFLENNNLIVPKQMDDNFYFVRGYFKVIDQKPSYNTSTQYIVLSKWEVNENTNTIKAIYDINDKTSQLKQVRKFSKLKITLFCIENNIWQDVKEYLEKIGYYDLFVMAVYFLETDEYFTKGLQMFKEARTDANLPMEELDKMIEQMLSFAHDGYVTIDTK